MKNIHFLLRYLVVLGVLLGGAFGVHAWVRSQAGQVPTGDLLSFSYLFNFAAALGILAGLYLVRVRMKNQIGFLFIGGSLLKFLVFFLFFYPFFKADGSISRAEFFSFFVPYFLALVTETYFTASMLRNLERENPG